MNEYLNDNSSHHHTLKVQFAENIDHSEHNSEIQIQVLNQVLINVHLGFLQIDHKYEIEFCFEYSQPLDEISNVCSGNAETEKTNQIEIIKVEATKSEQKNDTYLHKVTAHLSAFKEKFLKESIVIDCGSKTLTFIFNARVLGSDKGTPLLKNGIKRIGFSPNDQNH
ncbi:hypothetical protein SSS_00480 [Sarcoptes scabiei]|uniref:Adipose-secreted signaling protein n=1 Tax=Sarcoptes scabiei TaxID=52283 RepID=A0A834R504_SARSC|nr:hypothetical protein SSS_00480 [Sarcoptes scabiei]